MKAELNTENRRLLGIRNVMNRKRPEFHRQEWFRYVRLGTGWRRPRGKHSKLREKKGYRHARVESGYRGPVRVRHLHPSGFQEVRISTVAELEGINPSTQAVRISSTVGARKRKIIQDKARAAGIRILNEVR